MSLPFEHLASQSLRPQEGLRSNNLLLSGDQINRLASGLEEWINGAGWSFSCQEIELSAEEVCAPDGLLPLVLLEARRCQAQATGSAPLRDVEHVQSPTGLCGVSIGSLKGLSVGQWLLFSSFALEARVKEYGKPGPVPLDAWYANWALALDRAEVLVAEAPAQPTQPAPAQSAPSAGLDGGARG